MSNICIWKNVDAPAIYFKAPLHHLNIFHIFNSFSRYTNSMLNMFFSNMETIWRTIIASVLTYTFLIAILRITGKRTLSKLNVFDFIITVALGSTVASIIISKDVDLTQGALALTLLAFLQFAITWLSTRFPSTQSIFRAKPILMFYKGSFCYPAMKKMRVTENEILQAIREQGLGSTEHVGAVVLETNGSFSVIRELIENETSTVRRLL